jgi:hypothetical protein
MASTSTLLSGAAVLVLATAARAQAPDGAVPPAPAPSPFVEARFGARAALRGDDGETRGTLAEHVSDARTGVVLGARVQRAADERPVFVPGRALAWSAARRELALAEESALADAPALAGDATLPPDASAAANTEPPARVTSRDVLACGLVATDLPFGAIRDLVLEPRRGRIAYLLLRGGRARGADRFPVPWEALTWRPATPEDAATGPPGRFVIRRTGDEMADAPLLEKGDVERLADPALRARIRAFYHLPPEPEEAPEPPSGDGPEDTTGG